jgi:starch synthase
MTDASSPRILFVSAESRPFASTGGLADVAEALPEELNRLGAGVDRIMPLYRKVWEGQGRYGYTLNRTPHTLKIPLGMDVVDAEIFSCERHGTLTYFVGCDEYFDRSELYALPQREYRDNFTRFLFFQKAVVALIDGLGHPYDAIHLNDWQTGLIPLLLEKGINGTGRFKREKVLMTIHNMAYQGIYPAPKLFETNLPGNTMTNYPTLEYYGQLNQLKAGILGADRVNTVSPTYAREIETPGFGCGLDGVLRSLAIPVMGVVNGVDLQAWNPETDTALSENYTANALSGKETCKKKLVAEFGLEYDKDVPLFVLISRLVDQKGVDVIAAAMERMMSLPLQFVLLGSGQEQYHRRVAEWNQRWPKRFAGKIGYDVDLSHRIEAGGDFFLMPSAFEPCGLNQLYSLRYGTVPVVNRVGGLVDTVRDIRHDPENGTGFVMSAYSAEGLLECIQQAVSLFHDKKTLRRIRQHGMRQDVSWEQTATAYLNLYRDMLKTR